MPMPTWLSWQNLGSIAFFIDDFLIPCNSPQPWDWPSSPIQVLVGSDAT